MGTLNKPRGAASTGRVETPRQHNDINLLRLGRNKHNPRRTGYGPNTTAQHNPGTYPGTDTGTYPGTDTGAHTGTYLGADSGAHANAHPVYASGRRLAGTETITFDGQWRQFAIRGTGLERVDLAINVINYPDGPSSTGAVELESGSSLPSATDACRTTYYTGYTMSVDWTFSLVGCQAGTVIIRLSDPANDYAVLREYTVTVSGGP